MVKNIVSIFSYLIVFLNRILYVFCQINTFLNPKKSIMKTSIIVIILLVCSQVLSQTDNRDRINPDSNSFEQIKHSFESVHFPNSESKTIINKTILGNGFLLVENIRERWDGAKWIYNYMFAWVYDGNDNIIEYSFFRWGGSGSDVDWTPSWMITYIYDGNDNNIQWVYSNWGGSNWIDNGMSTNRYDKNDNKIEETFQMWNGSTWVLANRHTYDYDGKKMIKDIREMWNGSAWVLAQKNTYTYDENKMIENLSQMWNGFWVNEKKHTYTFDENDNRIEVLHQIWYISDWANQSRNLYQYDEKKITEDLSQVWVVSDWENESKKTFTYDENNKRLEYLSQVWVGFEWVNKSKNTYTYDGSANLTEDLYQDWRNSDWVNERTHMYFYDGNNNKIEDVHQQWNGSNWVNIERDTYSYNLNTVGIVFDENQNIICKLSNNYPNPFNPSTTINYSISEKSNVTLKIFDVQGREISKLVFNDQQVGSYEIEFDANKLTGGIYFYQIKAGNYVESKKMILIK